MKGESENIEKENDKVWSSNITNITFYYFR